MSLDKAIEHKKEKRKPYYRKAQSVDPQCRCHGSCSWCRSNRTIREQREKERMKEMVR